MQPTPVRPLHASRAEALLHTLQARTQADPTLTVLSVDAAAAYTTSSIGRPCLLDCAMRRPFRRSFLLHACGTHGSSAMCGLRAIAFSASFKPKVENRAIRACRPCFPERCRPHCTRCSPSSAPENKKNPSLPRRHYILAPAPPKSCGTLEAPGAAPVAACAPSSQYLQNEGVGLRRPTATWCACPRPRLPYLGRRSRITPAERVPVGTPEFIEPHLHTVLARQASLLDTLPALQDSQVAWLLLSYCMAPRAQYAIRNLPLRST